MKKTELLNEHIKRIDFAVQNGLANNQASWKPVKLLHGGLSGACTYLIQVGDKPYVIKLEKLDQPEVDLPRYFSVVELASQKTISPTVYFCDAVHGVILMQYIDPKPRPQPSTESIKEVASLLRKIHDGPVFPAWKSVFEILDHFYKKLSDEYQKTDFIQQCMQHLVSLQTKLSDPADIRPSHCDLNPSNVLFDGQKLYLVDWQAASPQSFYFDLACCANWFYFYNEELCQSLLKEYFGRLPNREENEKYTLMRQFANIYYGIGFVAIASQGKVKLPPLSPDEIALLPSYLQFMQSIGQGKANLADPSTQQQFGYSLMNTV